MQLVGAFAAETAGQHDQQLFEVGIERRVDALLNPELDPHDHRLCGRDHGGAALDIGDGNFGGGGPCRDRDIQQRLLYLGEADGVFPDEVMVDRIGSHQSRQQSPKQEGVGAGANGEMQVGHLGGLRAARINDDQLARGILANVIEVVAGIGETMRDPGVRTDHQQEIAAMHILRGVTGLAAEHMAVDPEVAGLLLRQRVEDIARTERAQERIGIGAAGVVALPAPAIERQALAAVPVDQVSHPLGDLGNRDIPRDRIEAAVGATAQRRREPVLVVRVVRNARRLVAEIALRFRAGTIAPDLFDMPVIDQDFDAAIDVTEIAGRLVPCA